MSRSLQKKILAGLIAVPVYLATLTSVKAQNNILPKPILDLFNLLGPGGAAAAAFITSRVQAALIIALGVVVLVAVLYAIIAALKYISSQGDEGKIEEAQKGIKAIFFGIGAMLIGIVGITLVFVFFGAVQPVPALYQVCLSAPSSQGCTACENDSNPDGATSLCKRCNDEYVRVAQNKAPLDATFFNQTCSGKK